MTDYNVFAIAAEGFVEDRLRSLGEKMEWNNEELQALLDANTELKKQCNFSGLGKKKKKRQDPNEPKRSSTAYIHFSKENRERVVKENPDLDTRKIMAKLGEEWKKLGEKQKKKYDKKAKDDKVRYEKEMAEYKANKEKLVEASASSSS
jgi:hypothetical protein